LDHTKNTLSLILIIVFFGQSIIAQNKLRLPSLVSDNMVIQQSSPIEVWGWAEKKIFFKSLLHGTMLSN